MPVDDTPSQRMFRIMEGHPGEPTAELGPRLAVGRRPAVAAGLVAVLGLLVCGWLALRPSTAEVALPPRASVPGAAPIASGSPALSSSVPSLQPLPSGPAGSAGLAGSSGSVPASGGALSVYVVGQVRSPGVVSLNAGARVVDAIEAAGGATSRADLTAVNLARKLTDGEQIMVPRPGQAVPPASPGGAETPGAETHWGAAVNLNTATQAQLDELPGVGPVIAGRIVEWRQQNGQFTSVDQLGEVSGIGDATLAKLRSLVTV